MSVAAPQEVNSSAYIPSMIDRCPESLSHWPLPLAPSKQAMMLSSFDEVLFLDEDNLPLRDPSTLFDDMHYFGITGLFWNDIWAMVQTAPFYRFLKGGIPLTSLGLSQVRCPVLHSGW